MVTVVVVVVAAVVVVVEDTGQPFAPVMEAEASEFWIVGMHVYGDSIVEQVREVVPPFRTFRHRETAQGVTEIAVELYEKAQRMKRETVYARPLPRGEFMEHVATNSWRETHHSVEEARRWLRI